jgi:hypothetical protein
VNVAVTEVVPLIIIRTGFVVLLNAPDHPLKLEPVVGVAVKMTVSPK